MFTPTAASEKIVGELIFPTENPHKQSNFHIVFVLVTFYRDTKNKDIVVGFCFTDKSY